MKKIIITHALIAFSLVLASCASIPPEAVTHTEKTKQFHDKTSEATLKVFDSVVDTTTQLSDLVIRNQYSEWRHSISIYTNLSADLQEWRHRLGSIKGQLEKIEKSNSAQLKQLDDIGAEISDIKSELARWDASVQKYKDDAEAALKTDTAVLNDFQDEFVLRTSDFRELMQSSTQFTGKQIEKQSELLKSYVIVQKNREKLWGEKMSSSISDIEREISSTASSATKIVEEIRDVVNVFN